MKRKPSNILIAAAVDIANMRSDGCCGAISSQFTPGSTAAFYRAKSFFAEIFKPLKPIRGSHPYWWGYPWSESRARNDAARGQRILALTLAAAMLKGQGE
jgi:hypothetical protein